MRSMSLRAARVIGWLSFLAWVLVLLDKIGAKDWLAFVAELLKSALS